MRIKVCGMRHPSNIQELVRLNPDYIGFIFYPESKRYIGTRIPEEVQEMIPVCIKKVGVFVDEPFGDLLEKFIDNRLDMVQLHGSELPDYCGRVKKLGIPIIKVFSISADFDFESVIPFEEYCDYYLFDTAGDQRGGTGIKFDWGKLDQYVGNKPFFLSGGIRPTDIAKIKGIFHKHLHAIDLNSGFETEPAIKDIPKLKIFLEGVRSL